MQGGLKRIAVLSVVVVVVVAVAYILGSATGAYLRGGSRAKSKMMYRKEAGRHEGDGREHGG